MKIQIELVTESLLKPIKPVEEVARPFMGMELDSYDVYSAMRADRQDIHTSLVAAVEGLKRKHYEDTAFMKHRNDFNDAYNVVVDDILSIINSIFKE